MLIGASTQDGAFTENIVKDMAAQANRPIILPLSNPSGASTAVAGLADPTTPGATLLPRATDRPAHTRPADLRARVGGRARRLGGSG